MHPHKNCLICGCLVDLRELKALELAARAKIVFADGAWRVPSQSKAGTYRVIIDEPPSCECEDFQLRQQPCKHVLAVQHVRREARVESRR